MKTANKIEHSESYKNNWMQLSGQEKRNVNEILYIQEVAATISIKHNKPCWYCNESGGPSPKWKSYHPQNFLGSLGLDFDKATLKV